MSILSKYLGKETPTPATTPNLIDDHTTSSSPPLVFEPEPQPQTNEPKTSTNFRRFHKLLTDISRVTTLHKTYRITNFGNLQRTSFAVKLREAYQEARAYNLVHFPHDLTFATTIKCILVYAKGHKPNEDNIYVPQADTYITISHPDPHIITTLLSLASPDHMLFSKPLRVDGQVPPGLIFPPDTLEQHPDHYLLYI